MNQTRSFRRYFSHQICNDECFWCPGRLRIQPGFHCCMLIPDSKALPRPIWRKPADAKLLRLFLSSTLLKVCGIIEYLNPQHSSWCSVRSHHLHGTLELCVHCYPVMEALSCFSRINGSSPRHPAYSDQKPEKAHDVVAVETDNGTVIPQLGAAHNIGCGQCEWVGKQKRLSYPDPINHISYPKHTLAVF